MRRGTSPSSSRRRRSTALRSDSPGCRVTTAGVRPGGGPRPLGRGPAGQQRTAAGRHHVAREAEVQRRLLVVHRGLGRGAARAAGGVEQDDPFGGRVAPNRRRRAGSGRGRGRRVRSRRPGRPWRGAASLGGRARRTDVRSPRASSRAGRSDAPASTSRSPGRRRPTRPAARSGGPVAAGRLGPGAGVERRTLGTAEPAGRHLGQARARPRARGPGCGCRGMRSPRPRRRTPR